MSAKVTGLPGVPVIASACGWVTALGCEVEDVWQRLANGESAIAPCRTLDASGFRNENAGEVEAWSDLSGEDRLVAFTRTALESALKDAGLNKDALQRAGRVEMIVGASFGMIFHNEDGPVALDHAVRKALADLAIEVDLTVVSSACSSSSDALAVGYDLISSDEADMVIAGGVDILDRYKFSGHSSLSTLSPSQCRPFAEDANGMVMGEGAAFIVLESLPSAQARGVCADMILAGVAATTDTNTLTSPDVGGEGARRAIRMALRRAQRSVDDVAYINAHGSGTPVNDAMEAQVYADLFAQAKTPLSSTKSAFGHTLGATGAIEAIVTMEALRRKTAPPTALSETPSAVWADTGLVLGKAHPLDTGDTGLSVTYGFGGANVALVFVFAEEEEA